MYITLFISKTNLFVKTKNKRYFRVHSNPIETHIEPTMSTNVLHLKIVPGSIDSSTQVQDAVVGERLLLVVEMSDEGLKQTECFSDFIYFSSLRIEIILQLFLL